jgi:hypothetical protein
MLTNDYNSSSSQVPKIFKKYINCDIIFFAIFSQKVSKNKSNFTISKKQTPNPKIPKGANLKYLVKKQTLNSFNLSLVNWCCGVLFGDGHGKLNVTTQMQL